MCTGADKQELEAENGAGADSDAGGAEAGAGESAGAGAEVAAGADSPVSEKPARRKRTKSK